MGSVPIKFPLRLCGNGWRVVGTIRIRVTFDQSRVIARSRKKGDSIVRKLMIAAALVSTALATPAVARDGSAYVGIDAGVVKPSSLDLRFTNSAVSVDNGERLRHKWGYDVDAVFGSDFVMFLLQGGVGYKHASLKSA